MRLVISKLLLSCYLCFLAYQLLFSRYTSESLGKVLTMNVEALGLSDTNTEFLRIYLSKIIAFCFAVSLVTVLSKNLLPKLIVIVGIALWIGFAFHPKLAPSTMLMQRAENVAIAGALLFIGGSEYFEKQITFADFR
jgi:hypothetical protein